MSLDQLKELLLKIRKIGSIEAILHWDQETSMPDGSGDIRAEQMAYLSSLAHDMLTGKEFRSLLEKEVDIATGEALAQHTDPETKRLLYLIWKEYRDASVLPTDFVVKFTRLSAKSQQVWAKARQENDFSAFAPYLEKMALLKRQEAEYYGYETTPYDSLLDKFEPAMTSKQLAPLFDELRGPLVELVQKIKNSDTAITDKPLKKSFSLNRQWEFAREVAEAMGYDFNTGRMDKSAHPFTTSFHPTDVRITIRLKKKNFKTGLFATIHETGHALYEQGLPVADYGTPFGDAISMGIHESQSRLWENLVGRSKPFWNHFFPILKEYFKTPLKGIGLDQFYKMINMVTPSLIRIEADEVTYSLHILIRYEIEKMLIDENLPIKEIPEVWNQKMEEYLGIKPKDYKEGVLQDVHWSAGLFGYFPTYTLGNLYAASIMEQVRQEIPNLEKKISRGHLLPLRQWLEEKIHTRGQRRFAGEIIRDITGNPLSAQPFLQYLKKKYSELYQIR